MIYYGASFFFDSLLENGQSTGLCMEQIWVIVADESDSIESLILNAGLDREHEYRNDDGNLIKWKLIGVSRYEIFDELNVTKSFEAFSRFISKSVADDLLSDTKSHLEFCRN